VSAESEGDVAAELGMNCNLGKTIMSVCPAWRCPHHPPLLELESSSTSSWRCPHQKVKNAVSVLRHSALSWWESLDPYDKPQTWNDMKLLMREAFLNPPPVGFRMLRCTI
jgi:hypothetical protein